MSTAFEPSASPYDHGKPSDRYRFLWSNPNNRYLRHLRARANLDSLVSGCPDDLHRCHTVCTWVHGLWTHDGWNEPRRSDPLSILEEAERGRRFRCVEYSIVINGCLNALAIPARLLGLKTQDVETRESGAGHVAVEAWLRDQKRWCLIDGQWNAIPLLHDRPLSAVELREALDAGGHGLSLRDQPAATAADYLKWIEPYLYYMDTRLDGRIGGWWRRRGSLMLVPIGARQPVVFQRRWPMRHLRYTTFVTAFYPVPAEAKDVPAPAAPQAW